MPVKQQSFLKHFTTDGASRTVYIIR